MGSSPASWAEDQEGRRQIWKAPARNSVPTSWGGPALGGEAPQGVSFGGFVITCLHLLKIQDSEGSENQHQIDETKRQRGVSVWSVSGGRGGIFPPELFPSREGRNRMDMKWPGGCLSIMALADPSRGPLQCQLRQPWLSRPKASVACSSL